MAKRKALKRLAKLGNKDRDIVADKIKDWLDHELVITSAHFKEGEHGEFAVFLATDENEHDHVFVSGAMFVVDALREAIEGNLFPLAAKFYMRGNTVLFT